MIRRFMNWLLHQLQRFLTLIGGRQSPAHQVTPSRENQTAQHLNTSQREPYSASAEANTSTQAGISFSIGTVDSPASQPSTLRQNTIQESLSNTEDDADTHMRLDAASSTVPGSRLELSDVEDSADKARSPLEPIPPADQLPSIHDLLPAVEQEIKESAAQQSADDTSYSDTLTTDPIEPLADNLYSPLRQSETAIPELELAEPDVTQPAESTESEQTEPDLLVSEQALLFSFDITENADDRTSKPEVEDSADRDAAPLADTSAEDLSDTENLPALVEDDIDAVTSVFAEADTPLESFQESSVPTPTVDVEESVRLAEEGASSPASDIDTTQLEPEDKEKLPRTENSNAIAVDRASLPYPWSIATPKKSSNLNDKTVVHSEASKPTDVSVGTEGIPEAEPVSTRSTQVDQFPVKNGVVKLLFTMKEGNFHGYIEPSDGTSDILFHQKYINEDIFESLERGVEVVVSVKYIEGKAYATQVALAE